MPLQTAESVLQVVNVIHVGAGVVAFLAKPFSADALVKALDQALVCHAGEDRSAVKAQPEA